MNCSHCQRELLESSNFCPYCGARQRTTAFRRRLMRSTLDSKLGGVCGGIGEYFDVDPTMVRLIWIVLSVVPGALIGGVVAYLVAWIVIPKAPFESSVPSGVPLEHAAK